MSEVMSMAHIEQLFNEHCIDDIQLIDAGNNQTKLSFISPEHCPTESEPFNDQELESVIDFILESKSRLNLGC